ncbi:MAG: hypothetical protein AUH15_01620 [Acidobacteriales bacterium 13_2_20CM_55_8]|nr:MAG: hypothetical protein AUH15_01620 [Acidobacteriales bacterium 13_2_20CM_55_8]
MFSLACGSGTNLFNQGSGNFSNASLKGQYAYQLTGVDTAANFREAGVFTADGNGNITGGTDDFSEGTTITSGSSTGAYTISNDGTGVLAISISDGRALQLAVTLVNSSKVYLMVTQTFDFANGAGIAKKQDPATFAAPPSGTFTFRNHNVSTAQGSSATVGVFTVSGGTVSGSEDVNRAGVLSSPTFTGSFNSPDTSGRGTGTFTDNANVTSTFIYYVVDTNNLRFFSTNNGAPGLGRAETQTGAPFANTSLAGSYAFGSSGDDNFSVAGAKTVGRFTAGGDGTISAGAYDSVEDGTVSTNISFTGTYSMASNGRATVTLNPSTGTIQQIFWMVSPSRAFSLTSDPNKVEDGTLDLQQAITFSNSTMKGQFAVLMDGFDPFDFVDRVGTLQWDGAGNLTLDEFINRSGTTQTPGFITGTYSIASNGRASGAISGLSNNLVFYLISGSDGYILQNDTSTEIDGVMSKQP